MLINGTTKYNKRCNGSDRDRGSQESVRPLPRPGSSVSPTHPGTRRLKSWGTKCTGIICLSERRGTPEKEFNDPVPDSEELRETKINV